jgi:excisionase family DNA binding protein
MKTSRGAAKLRKQVAAAVKDANLLHGNLLGMQRRAVAAKPGWEQEVLPTVKRLMPAAARTAWAAKAMLAAMAGLQPEGNFAGLRVAPRQTEAGLSAAEAAKRLGLCAQTMVKMLREGRLPGKKIGKMWRVTSEVVAQYAAHHTVGKSCWRVASPAKVLNKKQTRHEWADNGNCVVCSRCALSVPATMDWRHQIAVGALNGCAT